MSEDVKNRSFITRPIGPEESGTLMMNKKGAA
jgi:hypothetical protein